MIPLIFKTPKDAVHVDKESGTSVDYHIFDEYEIHVNQVMPHTTQEWHSHAKIIETLFVTKGKLLCRYLKDTGEEESRYLEKNELVQVGNRVHTFENDTDEIVEFLVFRFVPDGTDKLEMIREDKRLCSVAEDALGAAGK